MGLRAGLRLGAACILPLPAWFSLGSVCFSVSREKGLGASEGCSGFVTRNVLKACWGGGGVRHDGSPSAAALPCHTPSVQNGSI